METRELGEKLSSGLREALGARSEGQPPPVMSAPPASGE